MVGELYGHGRAPMRDLRLMLDFQAPMRVTAIVRPDREPTHPSAAIAVWSHLSPASARTATAHRFCFLSRSTPVHHTPRCVGVTSRTRWSWNRLVWWPALRSSRA